MRKHHIKGDSWDQCMLWLIQTMPHKQISFYLKQGWDVCFQVYLGAVSSLPIPYRFSPYLDALYKKKLFSFFSTLQVKYCTDQVIYKNFA